MFAFTDDNKRYHTLAYHNKHKYGGKVCKAVIDAGFTCPNKDGSKGTGGCAFCRSGSGYFTGSPTIPVMAQLDTEINRIRKKYPHAGIIAYFQANTNTYAPVEKLRELYLPVARSGKVKGISIAARADCLPDETVRFLAELSSVTDLTVELGMQTIHNNTLDRLNICITHDEFCEGFMKLKNIGVRTCLHIINGLPNESVDMMLETARKTALLHPDAVKIQLLHVLRDTPLHQLYTNGGFSTMSMEDYISVVIGQLELLPPEIVVERVTGDGDRRFLAAPLWSLNKKTVLGALDKEMARRNTFQGSKQE